MRGLGCWSSPTLYLSCDAQPQIRRLYFRNLSKLNLVVKLLSSKPHVVELARSALRLEPWSSLFIEARFMSSNVGTFDYADPKISGYAMPIYSYTLSKISHWLNTPGVETEKQLAFELNVKFNNNVFSAPNIIVDLPGTACLVVSVPKAIPMTVDAQPVDWVDSDTETAVQFSMNELSNTGVSTGNESCWFSNLMNNNSNPTNEVAARYNHVKADSNLKTTQRQDFSQRNEFESVAERSANINVEQEATPCGGH